MAKKTTDAACCDPGSGIRFQAVVSVDDRGQMVLPKEIRKSADIRPGDKLALVSWEKGGKVCCLSLVKVDEMTTMVGSFLRPFLNDISGKGGKTK
ncbi:MAG: AbrB/MazE/SpoVT family DNA-binding domain-containing protein [Nitrospinae bacterium]|nr:AbrB/MazE/SpoVT family DNA-binding domain-containing protein [Nitrospinota bacterium]